MMRTIRSVATFVLAAHLVMAQQPGRGQTKGTPPPASITAKPDELARIKDKTEQIEALVKELNARHADPMLLGDVEVYGKAGRMLLEIPDMFGSQAAVEHAFAVLDQGIERGRQLKANQPQWNQGKKQIHAYYSEIDGAVLPYGITLPESYDPTKPTRLYVCRAAIKSRIFAELFSKPYRI